MPLMSRRFVWMSETVLVFLFVCLPQCSLRLSLVLCAVCATHVYVLSPVCVCGGQKLTSSNFCCTRPCFLPITYSFMKGTYLWAESVLFCCVCSLDQIPVQAPLLGQLRDPPPPYF